MTYCIGVFNAKHNFFLTWFIISEMDGVSRILDFGLRGWVRKFCHRWYNFVNRHDRLLYYTLIERATFLLYNDAKIMPEINKYLEIDALKDTWGKTNGTFSRICEYYYVRFMRHIFITTDQIFSNFLVINNSIFRNAV